MLEQPREHTLASTIFDVVLQGDRVFAALEDGLVVLEHGAVVRRFEHPVRSLVTSDDGQTLLAVSPLLNPPPHYPWRSLVPAEEKRLTHRIHRLSAPWTTLEDLGLARVEGWCSTFDGRYWPTFEGDDVHVYECTATGIECRARFETFWPYHMQRTPEGIWLETSSLGASHFQILSVPDLRVIDAGDIRCCKIEFPPESFSHRAMAPSLGSPLLAVAAAEMSDENHPIRNVDRIMTLEGRVVATLPCPTAGLASSDERALFWVKTPRGISFLLIDRETARVTFEFTIDGAPSADARIFGRDIAIWERNTLRVLHDAGDA